MPKVQKPKGRPSVYSEDVAERICDELIDGKSLRQICQADKMPNRSTVLRWLDADTDFAAKYARARESQADLMDDKILEVAEAATAETAQADRVKIMAYQWRASKLLPKKYGDKQTLDVTHRYTDLPDEDLNAEILRLQGG